VNRKAIIIVAVSVHIKKGLPDDLGGALLRFVNIHGGYLDVAEAKKSKYKYGCIRMKFDAGVYPTIVYVSG